MTQAGQETPDEIRAKITPKKRWPWVVGALVLLVVLLVVVSIVAKPKQEGPVWELGKATRGDISLKVSATGTLEPRRQVTVGSEISGQIESVSVNTNDQVTKGQVLAKLDLAVLDNERAQALASRDAAGASVARAKANLEEANLFWDRQKQLKDSKSVSQADLDTARARALRAKADLRAAYAELRRAKASLNVVNTRREMSVITSPIDGVILRRAIEPGTTVASAFQAPELFVIAEDLSKMELQVLINEADVGLVKQGQTSTFGVDAWPDKKFLATVQEIELSPTKVGNVVTYKTTLTVENKEGLLRPGMTAAVEIDTGKKEGVLRIPVKALLFKPEEKKSGFSFGRRRKRKDERERGSSVYLPPKDPKEEPTRVILELGRADGDWVEVRSGKLKEGQDVVVDIKEPTDDSPTKGS